MMTFKELKKLVKLPLYKEQRVPTVKALEESGVSVVAEKILENHGSISVYQNGYVIYRAHKRVTVFSLRNCVHYKYDALEGAGHHIEEEEFDEYEWHIRLVLEGEDRIFMNYEIIQGKWMPSREDREYREEILEGVDEAVSTLERMISEERVEELLSTLTDRPKNFRGRPFGVGDVIVINQQGEITAYFVDKDSLVVVAGFIRSSSSGILVTLDTKNLFIDGCAGTWMATEECVVESQHFFLMQHEVYKEKAPNVIVDASGKLVSTEIRKGLDEDARKKILDYLHPPLMEKPMNQKPSLHQMEHYQKFYENGEYVRAVESTTEQNYNMIDGCANNLPKPRIINGRESVLDKLRIRQMAREKQKSSQEQSADMERNRK